MEAINGYAGQLIFEDHLIGTVQSISTKYEGEPNDEKTWNTFQKEISGTLCNAQIDPSLKRILHNHRLGLLAHKAYVLKRYGG